MLNQEINDKKLNLNQVYNLKEPEPYYQSINQYEYDLPERAKPYFQKIINTYVLDFTPPRGNKNIHQKAN